MNFILFWIGTSVFVVLITALLVVLRIEYEKILRIGRDDIDKKINGNGSTP